MATNTGKVIFNNNTLNSGFLIDSNEGWNLKFTNNTITDDGVDNTNGQWGGDGLQLGYANISSPSCDVTIDNNTMSFRSENNSGSWDRGIRGCAYGKGTLRITNNTVHVTGNGAQATSIIPILARFANASDGNAVLGSAYIDDNTVTWSGTPSGSYSDVQVLWDKNESTSGHGVSVYLGGNTLTKQIDIRWTGSDNANYAPDVHLTGGNTPAGANWSANPQP